MNRNRCHRLSWKSKGPVARNAFLKIHDASGTLIKARTYQYEGLANGDTRTTETRTRNEQTTVIRTTTDMIGRIVESSTNNGLPGSGVALTSDDYAGGGHTLLTDLQDPHLAGDDQLPAPTA